MGWAKNIPLASRIKDLILNFVSIAMFHVFRKPIEYISFTFSSYYSLKKNYLFMFVYFAVLIVFSIALTYYSNPKNAISNRRSLYSESISENRILSSHYDNLRASKTISLPTIQSDVIKKTEPFVKLFIPYTKRMDDLLD